MVCNSVVVDGVVRLQRWYSSILSFKNSPGIDLGTNNPLGRATFPLEFCVYHFAYPNKMRSATHITLDLAVRSRCIWCLKIQLLGPKIWLKPDRSQPIATRPSVAVAWFGRRLVCRLPYFGRYQKPQENQLQLAATGFLRVILYDTI